MENKTNRVAPRDLLERALASPNGVRIFSSLRKRRFL